jgi:hypothetical protein
MAITYTWEITGLKTKDVDVTKPDAVVQTYWKKTGTDKNGKTGFFSGATPFTVDPTDDSGPFISFSELTEEDVIEWIKSVVVGGYEEHVNGKILEQIEENINPVVDQQLPWKPAEEVAEYLTDGYGSPYPFFLC